MAEVPEDIGGKDVRFAFTVVGAMVVVALLIAIIVSL